MDQLLSLEDAAVATGQPVGRLGNWCATGKLACEKVDDTWVIPLNQLLRVAVLVAERTKAIAAGRTVAAVVPVTNATPDLPAEIARRLGLPEDSVSTNTLALDGKEYMLAVWRSGADGSAALKPIVDLVEELGGEILDEPTAT